MTSASEKGCRQKKILQRTILFKKIAQRIEKRPTDKAHRPAVAG